MLVADPEIMTAQHLAAAAGSLVEEDRGDKVSTHALAILKQTPEMAAAQQRTAVAGLLKEAGGTS
jgi:hypothetical protein